MNANDRNQCLHIFLHAGVDLLNLPYPDEATREKFIETNWKLIQDGIQLGLPVEKTIHDLADEMKEIREIGAKAYAAKYRLHVDKNGKLIE